MESSKRSEAGFWATEWVQVDGAAHHDRVKQVSFDLADEHDEHEHRSGGQGAARG